MITGALALAFLLAAALAAYRLSTRLSKRSPNDVYPFLLSIDMEILNGTFHPEAEDQFRDSLSPEEFKKVQFKRIHLAIHYCNKISNNAVILLGWTRYERKENWRLLDSELREMVFSLRGLCAQCRLSSFVIRLRLRWWLVRMTLLPFTPPPTFATLLRLGSADMISFYEDARSRAEAFSRVYGEDYHQKLMQAL